MLILFNKTNIPGDKAMSSSTAQPGKTLPARRSRRLVLLVSLIVCFLVLGPALGWYAWRRYTAPAPPEVALTEDDPELAAAVEAARSQVRREPYSAAAWGRLGEVLRAAEYRDQAAGCFAQARRLDPTSVRWPYLQGEALQQRDPDAALPPLRRAVQLCGHDDAVALIPRLRLGEVLLARGAYDEAETQLQDALKGDADNASVHLDLGLLACERGGLKEALDHLRPPQVSQYSVFTRKRACARLAEVYQRLGDEAAAARYSKQAADLPPDAHWLDPILMEVLRLEVGRPARFHEVERLDAQGNYPEAVRQLQEMMAQAPDYRVCVALGKNLGKLGDYRGAEQALRLAIQLEPDNAQAYYRLAMLFWVQARAGWEKEADRDWARARFRDAADPARRALAHKPDYAEAHMILGDSLTHLGERSEGLAELRLAVLCGPDLADVHYYLGEALAEDGQEAEARAQLELAAQLAGPGNPQPRQALERLNAAGKKPR
jgi:tetratricopeptide (TPR) repeat protein